MKPHWMILLLSFCFSALPVGAQRYQIYSVEGAVVIKSAAGATRTVLLDAELKADDRVSVPKGGCLSIYDSGKGTVASQGECKDVPVSRIVSNPRGTFVKRFVSMLKGTDASERAYVSRKGEDPLPEFVHAMHHPGYAPAFRVAFELIDAETERTVSGTLRDGQQVYFRVTNHEDIPLCIGILWIDSAGNRADCLEQEDRYVLIPGGTTVDLADAVMEVAPPLGTDTICLFAAEDFFDLGGLSDMEARAGSRSASSTVKIGYFARRFQIK